MARLIVQVEGVTEEEFVNELLTPHLCACGWETVVASGWAGRDPATVAME